MNFNLINGNIVTLDDCNPITDSITIKDGFIDSIGEINTNKKNIDLKGATVIPGFIDAHFHLTNLGKRLDMLQLKKCRSPLEILELIVEKSKQIDSNEWIMGFGWDHNKWDTSSYPEKNILNELSIPNPIMLTRIDGHSCWVNKNAIQLANIDLSDIPEGGNIINDCILVDNAMNPIQRIIPKSDEKMVEKWIRLALKIIISRGITNLHDAWQDETTIKVINKLIEQNEFPIRCYGMLASSNKQLLDHYFKNGHYKNKNYTIRSVKAFIDGALGSRGAALFDPYCDDTKNCGLILISSEEFTELANKCNAAGYQLCTHAIGDRGNNMVLNTYTNTIKNTKDHRWRIEHAQMIRSSDIPLFSKYGIVPSMQPTHCTSDMPWMDDRIGQNRIHRISRWKTFINSGCKIAGGSDCPIEEGNPLFEYYAAVTRQDHKGYPQQGWQPQEKVSRIEALKMFTTWAAYGEFSEHSIGRIKTGFKADLTVLSNDITKCNQSDILKTDIIMNIVDGRIIFSKQSY